MLMRVQSSQEAAWLEQGRSEETIQGPSSQGFPSQENEGGIDRTLAALTPSASVSQVQVVRPEVSGLSRSRSDGGGCGVTGHMLTTSPERGAPEAAQSREEDLAQPPKMLWLNFLGQAHKMKRKWPYRQRITVIKRQGRGLG